MKTIGFAGTFYTLWDVKVERVNVALGAWYDKVTCTYYQNLSKNLDEYFGSKNENVLYTFINIEELWERFERESTSDSCYLFTGSYYFVAEVLSFFSSKSIDFCQK